jgi:hypothetical protein
MTTYTHIHIPTNIINILYVQEILPSSINTINLSFVRCSAVYSIMRAINIICISSCIVQQLYAISMRIPHPRRFPRIFSSPLPLLFVFFSLRLRPCHPFILFTQPGPGPDPHARPRSLLFPPDRSPHSPWTRPRYLSLRYPRDSSSAAPCLAVCLGSTAPRCTHRAFSWLSPTSRRPIQARQPIIIIHSSPRPTSSPPPITQHDKSTLWKSSPSLARRSLLCLSLLPSLLSPPSSSSLLLRFFFHTRYRDLERGLIAFLLD